MADEYAKLGAAGVMLVDQEYAPTDGCVENAQNAEVVLDTELGGQASLQKRSGYTPKGTIFASSVVSMTEIKFIASV